MFDVLAVGELNVDVVLTGLKQPPVMGQEILAEQYTECMGSSTAICACAVSSLGAKTAFLESSVRIPEEILWPIRFRDMAWIPGRSFVLENCARV